MDQDGELPDREGVSGGRVRGEHLIHHLDLDEMIPGPDGAELIVPAPLGFF